MICFTDFADFFLSSETCSLIDSVILFAIKFVFSGRFGGFSLSEEALIWESGASIKNNPELYPQP